MGFCLSFLGLENEILYFCDLSAMVNIHSRSLNVASVLAETFAPSTSTSVVAQLPCNSVSEAVSESADRATLTSIILVSSSATLKDHIASPS